MRKLEALPVESDGGRKRRWERRRRRRETGGECCLDIRKDHCHNVSSILSVSDGSLHTHPGLALPQRPPTQP